MRPELAESEPGELVDQVRDLLRAVVRGAAGEGAREQRGEPVVPLGLVAQPALERGPHREQRHRGLLLHHHRRARGELLDHDPRVGRLRAPRRGDRERRLGRGLRELALRRGGRRERLGAIERGVHLGLGELDALGEQPGDDRPIEAEVARGDVAELLRGHLADGLVVAGLVLDPAERALVVAELARQPLHRLALVDRVGLDQRLHRRELLVRDRRALDPRDLGEERVDRGLQLRPGDGRRDEEQPRVLRGVRLGVDLVDEVLLALHLEREVRRVALAEHHREHVERRGVRVLRGGDREADVEVDLLRRVALERDPPAVPRRLLRARRLRLERRRPSRRRTAPRPRRGRSPRRGLPRPRGPGSSACSSAGRTRAPSRARSCAPSLPSRSPGGGRCGSGRRPRTAPARSAATARRGCA